MPVHPPAIALDFANLDDNELVAKVLDGHREAFAHIMQRCNQRLYRVARSVVGNDTEAEDVLQDAYLHAYRKLASFRGDAALLTWLTSIVLNEARGRLRRRHTMVGLEQVDIAAQDSHVVAFPTRFGSEDPVVGAARAQIRHLLENAIDELPPAFRTVYILREVEELSVEETALQLDIKPETVKTRLFRARRQLRGSLQGALASTMSDAFPFMGERCARVTAAVMARIETMGAPSDE